VQPPDPPLDEDIWGSGCIACTLISALDGHDWWFPCPRCFTVVDDTRWLVDTIYGSLREETNFSPLLGIEVVFLYHLAHSLVAIVTELLRDLKERNSHKNQFSLFPHSTPTVLQIITYKIIRNWEITCVGNKGAGCQLSFLFVSLFQLGDLSNPELRILTDQLNKIRHGGEYEEHFCLLEFNLFINLDLI
jgi:hypothetical protein